MSKVPSKNTSLELIVRKYLSGHGLRYITHCQRLPGRPDIYVKKYKTAIFVNGCFWHGHIRCKLADLPVSRKAYWATKISNNMVRDAKAKKALRSTGIKALTIWGCQLSVKKREKMLARLYARLSKRVV